MKTLLFSLLLTPFVFSAELITKPVVTIYLDPERTIVESQALYGEAVELIEGEDSYCKVRLDDDNEGYLLEDDITYSRSFSGDLITKSLFTNIYPEPDLTTSEPLMTLPYGSHLMSLDDADERWIMVELVNGDKAWVLRGNTSTYSLKNMEELLDFSKRFIGLPYRWGGRSAYGYDCSGFIQMLYHEIGIDLPRNSRDQELSDKLYEVDAAEPGDLLFFGEEETTHVALYLGDGLMIHATSKIRAQIQITDQLDYKLKSIRRPSFGE